MGSFRTAVVSLGIVAFGAAGCSSTTTFPAVVQNPDYSLMLRKGAIPEGTVYVRNTRGRILFSAPTEGFGSGREINIHAYAIEGSRIYVTIENEGQTLVEQRINGVGGQSIGLVFVRSYGGFKVRSRERINRSNDV